jgi:alpha-glucan,water dikinase
MHRYNKCYDILNSLDIKNSDNLIWVYIWLRYSYIRQLDWQRRFNTKPRELAYSMSRLTGDITNKICYLYGEAADNDRIEIKPVVLLKMALSTLGKGTGDGQKIRDEILQIMHKNKIKETNDHFYEQWHQKLHNNTTPDDIVICEALLAYLKSGGQMDTYWSVLKVGGVTRDRLANFERKITNEPHYMPQLIPDFEAFLYTLKAVHSTNDLSIMFESAKYAINNNSEFYEIIRYKNDWDTLKQIWRVTDGREALNKLIHSNLKDSGKVRDLLFYDICLESYLRQLVEKIIHINLDFDQYVNEITAILKNLVVSYDLNEIKICLDDWINIAEKIKSNIKNHNNYSVYSALKIKSITDRLSRILSHIVDYFNNHFDNKGRYLGTGFNCDKFVVDIFTEEVIRGTIFFTLSMILKKVEPILRKTANLGAWLIISRGKTIEAGKEIFGGSVGYSKTLQDVQFKSYDKPTVLLTEQVGGNEEIPPNVSCLIIIYSRDYPDILAHVSVRARNLGVPFMVCFDDTIAENLKKLVGQNIKMKINNQNVEILDGSNINKNSEPSVEDGVEENTKKVQAVRLEDGFPSIYLELDEFSKKYLGAKSNNTKVVFGKLPEWVKYPESFAIPFNVCEYYLDLEENSKVKSEIEVKLNF